MARFAGLLGIIVLLSLAYIFSTNRKAIKLKTILWGVGLQFLFAVLVFRFDIGRGTMERLGAVITHFLGFSYAGSKFVFGPLGTPPGEPGSMGFYFVFQVLPTIIFISAFFALMYYLGIMQLIIRGFAVVMTWIMCISGSESLNVAASIFMGQPDAPLTIRPFLPECTRSELMTIMTAGMAHVSGGIMAAYILYGVKAEHLLSAVVMPEDDSTKDENLLGAIARGTIDGGKLAFNVAIMLISFIALVAALDGLMGWIHNYWHWFTQNLATVLGAIFRPIAWLIGVPRQDTAAVGNLLGSRMVINELYAYTLLGAQKASLDPRSFTIATFALCGFANFSSIGIQIGGIGALAPNKRNVLAKLGFRAMLAGTMANLLSAAIVSILMKQ